jgi:hypothetical protein
MHCWTSEPLVRFPLVDNHFWHSIKNYTENNTSEQAQVLSFQGVEMTRNGQNRGTATVQSSQINESWERI